MSATNYYEILGVSEDTSHADLKMAFKNAAMKIHPGDMEKCKELATAYQVLSDPVQRGIYDHALKEVRINFRNWKLMGKDVVIPLRVPLECLYIGAALTVPFPLNSTCPTCKGKGSKSGASMKCSGCQGSRNKPRIVNPGPPVVQLPFPCDGCKGTGEAIREIINDEDRCGQCKGEKVLPLNKVLKIRIEKGMQNGQLIKFPTKSFGGGGGEYGIFFVIEQIVHPVFTRKGDHLFVEHTLSIEEATYGYEFELTHLDNRRLIIKSEPGVLTRPGQLKEVKDEGMPMYERPSTKGNLYIRFTAELPEVAMRAAMSVED